MAHWGEFAGQQAALAGRVSAIVTARKHHTLATLRRDGSPRVSGLELAFVEDDLVLGMMPGSLKLADVLRDPRVAVHALSDDPPQADQAAWKGDAKLTGRVVGLPASDADQPPGPRFWIDIDEVVLVHLNAAATELEIETWHPGRGREVMRRT